jgi:hypothetical protein
MPVISVTRLRVRSWRFLPGFLLAAFRSGNQACRAKGNLAVKVFNDRRNTFWTLTCWDSESAMRDFMLDGPHRTAMRKLLHWCDEASLVHWTQEKDELPSWSEAHQRMLRYGRPSKVNHPSEAQQAFHIEEPDPSRREVRLK